MSSGFLSDLRSSESGGDSHVPPCIRVHFPILVHSPGREKSQQEVTNEIQAIIRQITASVTFLPLINEPCKSLKPCILDAVISLCLSCMFH